MDVQPTGLPAMSACREDLVEDALASLPQRRRIAQIIDDPQHGRQWLPGFVGLSLGFLLGHLLRVLIEDLHERALVHRGEDELLLLVVLFEVRLGPLP